MYRIVIVHPSAGVNWSGGTENFAIELTNHLNDHFEVELLAGAFCSPNYYHAGGIPRTEARRLLANLRLNSLLKKVSTHPDIVIEHLTSFIPCLIRLLQKPADLIFPCNDYGGLAMAALVRKLTGTPILFKAATGLTGGGRSLTRCLRFQPDHLVVFSEEMANFAKKYHPFQQLSIIPNGVNLNQFTPQGKSLEINLPKPITLCVASLNKDDHKRVELVIKAIAKLPQVSLLICGDGPDRAYFQALGEKLLTNNRFAIKTVPFQQMPIVYRCADIFTLPSIDEPFGQAYIQAMACGLPVVATADEMRRYIVADAGILCDVTNADIYADAIATVLKQNWQLKARENAMGFSWEIVALNYRNLIIEMIQESKQPKIQTLKSKIST